MTLTDAYEICRPLNVPPAPASPSDLNRAIAAGYGLALHDLDAASAEARRYLRGAFTAEAALTRIDDAREALTRMEAALTGADQQSNKEKAK